MAKIHMHSSNNSKTPEYSSWVSMNQRCNNKNSNSFLRYGGRGISICDDWKSFEKFLIDMGNRPSGTTLDRIDPNKGYELNNCRWATRKQQQNNLRNNIVVQIDGESKTLHEWCLIYNIRYCTAKARIKRGWQSDLAILTPNKWIRIDYQNKAAE